MSSFSLALWSLVCERPRNTSNILDISYFCTVYTSSNSVAWQMLKGLPRPGGPHENDDICLCIFVDIYSLFRKERILFPGKVLQQVPFDLNFKQTSPPLSLPMHTPTHTSWNFQRTSCSRLGRRPVT